jgi:hypothetical protein
MVAIQRTKLDILSACAYDWCMSRCDVVQIARVVDFLVVCELVAHLASHYIPPMWTLAAILRESPEEGCWINLLLKCA